VKSNSHNHPRLHKKLRPLWKVFTDSKNIVHGDHFEKYIKFFIILSLSYFEQFQYIMWCSYVTMMQIYKYERKILENNWIKKFKSLADKGEFNPFNKSYQQAENQYYAYLLSSLLHNATLKTSNKILTKMDRTKSSLSYSRVFKKVLLNDKST
jgi:hypothetical protein